MLRLIALVALLGSLILGPAFARLAQQITWDDLIPAGAPLVDPLMQLPPDIRYEVGFIANVRYLNDSGQVAPDNPALRDAREMSQQLNEQGVAVDDLVAKFNVYRAEVEARDQMLNEALDGRVVRIPGYLLPLEFEDTGVREFLLVPYVGACIHTPPPPPNQIVHVNLETAYTTKGLFTAVWVTGQINAGHSSQSLSFVDGSSDIDVGYVITSASVEPYE